MFISSRILKAFIAFFSFGFVFLLRAVKHREIRVVLLFMDGEWTAAGKSHRERLIFIVSVGV